MENMHIASRRKKGRGIRAKREKRARSARWGGGWVAPGASLLISPLRPLINMQMRDICKTPGCQITPNENLADFLACLSGISETKPHGGFDGRCKT